MHYHTQHPCGVTNWVLCVKISPFTPIWAFLKMEDMLPERDIPHTLMQNLRNKILLLKGRRKKKNKFLSWSPHPSTAINFLKLPENIGRMSRISHEAQLHEESFSYFSFFNGQRNNWFFFLYDNKALWKQVEGKDWTTNYRSLISSPSTLQPDPFFQLKPFHIKYATKNPSGHCIHFTHYPPARQRAPKGSTAQVCLEWRNYLLPPRTKRGVHL